MIEPMGPRDHLLRWQSDGLTLELVLTPERAVHWPDMQTLFVADLHVGKAAVFRAFGVPVPRGTTAATLDRLSAVVQRTGARKLVVLGDFLHARESRNASTRAALAAWRQAHAELDCLVVLGNHDRHAGTAEAAEAELGFQVSAAPYIAHGIIGVHEAREAPHRSGNAAAPHPLVLAGHEHPVVTLRGRRDRLRLPCYALRDGVLTLPAFGAFTGGHEVDANKASLFVVGEAVRALC